MLIFWQISDSNKRARVDTRAVKLLDRIHECDYFDTASTIRSNLILHVLVHIPRIKAADMWQFNGMDLYSLKSFRRSRCSMGRVIIFTFSNVHYSHVTWILVGTNLFLSVNNAGMNDKYEAIFLLIFLYIDAMLNISMLGTPLKNNKKKPFQFHTGFPFVACIIHPCISDRL